MIMNDGRSSVFSSTVMASPNRCKLKLIVLRATEKNMEWNGCNGGDSEVGKLPDINLKWKLKILLLYSP